MGVRGARGAICVDGDAAVNACQMGNDRKIVVLR